jgi:ferric-dicitrate binding protein FerR (iron transport regulator)
MKMSDRRFDELMNAYLEAEIAPADLRELHRTVREHPDCRARFQAHSRLHVLMREAFAEQVELSELQESLRPIQEADRRKPLRTALWAVAACLILGLSLWGSWTRLAGRSEARGIGTCLYVSGSGQTLIQRDQQDILAAPHAVLKAGDRIQCTADTQAMLRLHDGTLISMEPLCRLDLMSSRQEPKVILAQGEALFEIAEQTPAAPFHVDTPHAAVTVLGTTFTLEASEAQTQLKVYEGEVEFTRTADGQSVRVQSEQRVDSAAQILTVAALNTPVPARPVEVLSLLPTDAATLDRGQLVIRPLKVEGKRRTCYLRFDVPAVGVFLHAKLRLTQTIDPGSGTLTFARGSHSTWRETTLDERTAPRAMEPVVKRTGVIQRRETLEVDITPLIQAPGPVTIVIDLVETGGHDIWFHPRKSDLPPQVTLTYVPTAPR